MKSDDSKPAVPTGRLDARLPDIAAELAGHLGVAQEQFGNRDLKLSLDDLEELAGILTDFGADIYAGAGLWLAYERHNRALFGTSLPLTGDYGVERHPTAIGSDRVHHLLWVVYPELLDGLVLAPDHRDIALLAGLVAPFLKQLFLRRSRDLGIKRFMARPNDFGWDVKRKLVWLGTKSYLFRLPLRRYIRDACDGDASIGNVDDFLHQECTQWSGLGVIDLLAIALDFHGDDAETLRGWYERHTAAYRVVSASKDVVEAVNVYSGAPYKIRMDCDTQPFRPGRLILGSLVPWHGEWYWSGAQKMLDGVTDEMIAEMLMSMKRRSPTILCRYWKEYEAIVRRQAGRLHARGIEYHGGKNLVSYPDGLTMAADWQREFAHYRDSAPPDAVAKASAAYGLDDGMAHMNLPQDLADEADGVGVFLDPNTGREMFQGFTPLVSALARRGEGLTREEEDYVRTFVMSRQISPAFVRRLVAEHGDASIRRSFLLSTCDEEWSLDYLLRRYKGRHFRKRYPRLSVL
jgi:hypothetical protein